MVKSMPEKDYSTYLIESAKNKKKKKKIAAREIKVKNSFMIMLIVL